MKNQEIDPRFEKAFNELQAVPERNSHLADSGRVNFLRQAAILNASIPLKKTQRHNKWTNLIQGKERLPVVKPLIAVVVAVMLFFSGTGVTVFAAQESLPAQTLYPLKIWSEDAILSLTASPTARLNYLLDFCDRRIDEMVDLLAAGSPIPESGVTRLETEMTQALELAAGMGNTQMTQQLEQIHLRAMAQLRIINSLMTDAPESAMQIILNVRSLILEQIQITMMGQTDQREFRLEVQRRRQVQGDSNKQTPDPRYGTTSPNPTLNSNGTPKPSGNGNGLGSGGGMMIGTPMPTVSGNGPGSGGDVQTGTPEQNGPGPNSSSKTPGPGGGSGNKP
jgi:hypothetical protein